MKPYRYLAISVTISVLAHLILLALLSETYLTQKEITRVFNVDIVSPTEVERNVPAAIIPRRVIKQTRREAPLMKSPKSVLLVKPETMFGDGDLKKVSEDVAESSVIEKAEAGPESKTTASETPSEKEKDMFSPMLDSSPYDKKKIEERGEGVSSERKVISFDTSDLKFRGYMRSLKEKIEGIWQYPEEAKKRERAGDLNMRFVIKRDGTLGEMEIIRPSGYVELDNAAMKAVKDASPFWPLPPDWEGDDYTIDGHFIYDMRGPYVW